MRFSGSWLMIFAQVAFTFMVVFVKIVRQEMDTFEVAFWRSIVAVPLLMLVYRKENWGITDKRTMGLRIVFGFGALCCFFAAAKGLYIADLSLISKVQPLLVAALAPLLLGASEKASVQIWGLMILALVGCSILLAPSLEVGSWYGVLAILAACFSAVAHLFLRKLRTEISAVVVMWFQVGSGVLALLACLITLGGVPKPPEHLWLPLLGVGFWATIGQLLMTSAYRKEKAAVVSVASYAGPLIAVLADLIAFDVLPTWNGYLGGGIVVFAGLLLIRNNHREKGKE
jgi:drug/metabolite transporter (DMT)-like permease